MDPAFSVPLGALGCLAAGTGLGLWLGLRRPAASSPAPLQDLEALAGIMVAELDDQGRFRKVPTALAELLAIPAGDLHGLPLADLVHGEDRAACASHCLDLAEGRASRCSMEVRLQASEGTRWVHLDGRLLPGAGLICLIRDIGETRRVQEALQESEERFRTIADTASCAIFTYGTTFNYVSGFACQLLGRTREELLRTAFWEVVHPDDREQVRQRGLARQRGEAVPGRYEFRVLRPDGSVRWVDFTAGAIQHGGQTLGLGTAFDITDRVAAVESRLSLERRMFESQRLESLGLMAGGVAHDFNNLLTIILGNASLAQDESEPGSLVHTSLHSIVETALRASDLTRQMLAYSGRGKFRREPLNLNSTVRSLTGLVETSIPRHVAVAYDLAEGLPALDADSTQLQQVILNLLTNAVEAIGASPGTVRVSTGLQTLGPDELAGLYPEQNLEPGPHLFLEVTDSGMGMDEETQRRIFDPFFTTKPAGRGLGLAAMQGIVRGHRGGIRLISEPGQGTTFRIVFPALEAPPHEIREAQPADADWKGHGVLLVVDDEAPLREMASLVLRRAGFEVLEAANGLDGVETLRVHAPQIRAVLLDISMPIMTGGEALPALRRIRPSLPVILTSGFDGEERVQQLLLEPGTLFLQKPYAAADLLGRMRDALGE
ncbi:MAG: PAS domain S-box protein [Holophagaceae bacterium]|nr:PAS domain S-box protein [Holophagaceae bacterium]